MTCKKCGADIRDIAVFCDQCGTKQTASERKKPVRVQGTGTVFKRGKTWYAQWTYGWQEIKDESGNVIKRRRLRKTKAVSPVKREAVQYLERMTNGSVDSESKTLESYWLAFADGELPKLSKNRQSSYRKAHERLSALMPRQILSISIQELQRVVNDQETYYAAKDIKNLISKIWQLAMHEGTLHFNIAEGIILPDHVEEETKPFTADDLKKMWNGFADGDTFVGYILLMCYTGMMPGELRQLEYSMINWDKKLIFGDGLKTDERKLKPIVLPDRIVVVLGALCDQTDNKLLSDVSEYKFYQRYYEALARNDIQRLEPYSCRHTAGTELALAGCTAPVIQRIMRHAKITTTQRYMHLTYVDQIVMDAVNSIGTGAGSGAGSAETVVVPE